MIEDFFSQLGVVVAFLAGMLSFFAPCTFSLMPVYFAYITGEATHNARTGRHVVRSAILFSLGFILFFILLGLSFGGLGVLLSQYSETIRIVGAIIMIMVGVYMLVRTSSFAGNFTISFDVKKFGFLTPFALGVLLAFSSTPCVGPVIGAIITFAFKDGNSFLPLFYLFVYAIGFMIPFIVFGFVIHRFVHSRKTFLPFVQHFHLLSALLLIFLGLIMLFDGFELLTLWLQSLYNKFDIPFIS